jgi:hypothetical protein
LGETGRDSSNNLCEAMAYNITAPTMRGTAGR